MVLLLLTPGLLPAGLTGKAAARPSRSMSPDQSASAGASVGRRNSGRSGPVASDQAKSSAYKGVSWHKHSQKWYAYIQSGGKMRGLGYFDSQANAAKAYDAEARKVPFPLFYLVKLCRAKHEYGAHLVCCLLHLLFSAILLLLKYSPCGCYR